MKAEVGWSSNLCCFCVFVWHAQLQKLLFFCVNIREVSIANLGMSKERAWSIHFADATRFWNMHSFLTMIAFWYSDSWLMPQQCQHSLHYRQRSDNLVSCFYDWWLWETFLKASLRVGSFCSLYPALTCDTRSGHGQQTRRHMAAWDRLFFWLSLKSPMSSETLELRLIFL